MTGPSTQVIGRRTAWMLAALVTLLYFGSARACQTPVYRYAMYKWNRAPYEITYVYDGKPADADRQVNAALQAMSDKEDKPVANVRFATLDASDKKALESVFPAIQESLKKHKDLARPFHVVHTPGGREVFAGRMTADGIKTLTDSPARKKINKLLAEGAPCVLVVLQGADDAQNAQADKAIIEVIKNAAKGLYTPAAEPEEEGLRPPGKNEKNKPAAKKVGEEKKPDEKKAGEKKPEPLAIATVTV